MAEAKKQGVFKKLRSFFRACLGEIKKITWPTAGTTTKNFFVVLVVIIVAGLFIFGLDTGLQALLTLVMNTGA